MSSFAALRVLVTLVVTVSLLSMGSDGRPLPSPSPISLRPRQLLSSSSTLPLPPLIIAGQRRAASFTQQRPEPIILRRRDDNGVTARSDSHGHDHEHDHYHDHDYPDRWTKDEMDHHSDHWAWHHGLMHEHEDHDHSHDHEHIHEHKRQAEPTEDMTERGLIGDLGSAVRPLLAPLEIIPGFVTIENLLFGDGDQDGGLLKTVGGLLLKVEPPKDETSSNQYDYSLLASKHDRTQVYLAPVNDTSDAGCTDETNGDVLTVRVKLPLMDMKGSAMEMCAAVANAPPSSMSLEACGEDETTDNMSMNGTSQFFTYSRSSGSLTPILMQVQSNNLDAQDGAANTTTVASTDDSASQDPTKSKMLMHFTLAANTTESSMDDDSASTDDAPAADASQPSDPVTRRQSTDDSAVAAPDASVDTGSDGTVDDGSDDVPESASADTTDSGDDTSKIFLAVTLLADGSTQPDDSAGSSASNSTSPSKLCKAKM